VNEVRYYNFIPKNYNFIPGCGHSTAQWSAMESQTGRPRFDDSVGLEKHSSQWCWLKIIYIK